MLKYLKLSDYLYIPSYNLLVGIGIAVSMLYLQYQNDFKNSSEDYKFKIHKSIFVSIVIGFMGAFTFDAYSKSFDITFNNLNSIGLTFLGGFLSGIFCLILCLKICGLKILETLNSLTIPFCIAHFLGRIGCFLAGCCFGKPTNSIFGVKFPMNSIPYYHYAKITGIHPTQLYESFFVFILIILFLILKTKNKFTSYLLSYSIFRFLIEFIRADDRGSMFNQYYFSPSQILTFSICIVSLCLIFNKSKIHSM